KMPLKEATKLMVHCHTNAIPVLGDNNQLMGQISSASLFKLGIPDFFTQMKSVGFIRYFDPFEKYFAIEANSLVRDVMSQDFIALPPDATLIEIVFAISVQHQDKVYIVNYKNELIGIIDQALLLERIINL
ncbi:MAG: CBS domain-containing protein, partial [Victivallaceae bacterium]